MPSNRVMSRSPLVALGVALATPIVGLALLLAAPSADPHWDHQPSHFWLVLGGGGDRRCARLVGRCVGTTAFGCPPVPRVDVVPRGVGIPRASCARDAQGADPRNEHGIRARCAHRFGDRERVRHVVGAPVGWTASTVGHGPRWPAPPAPPRRCRDLGHGVARRVAAARRSDTSRVKFGIHDHPGSSDGADVRGRGVALSVARARTPGWPARGNRRRMDVVGRGSHRGQLHGELEGLLVGVARPDGRRVRRDTRTPRGVCRSTSGSATCISTKWSAELGRSRSCLPISRASPRSPRDRRPSRCARC